MMLLLTVLGCHGPNGADGEPPPAVEDVAERLFRGSMALRGVPPTPEQVRQVREDPAALEQIFRSYLDDPYFRETVADMHAEQFELRWDIIEKYPLVGPLEGFEYARVLHNADEEPVKLAEHIVATGLPYTDLVTTELAMADEVTSIAFGLPWDPQGPEWQESSYTDGRPHAGILSSSALYQRYQAAELNRHRARGAWVLEDLLCEDLGERSASGIIDPHVADSAVLDDPQCVGCHAVMDPVSASFYGFLRYVLIPEIKTAHGAGCQGEDEALCYPLAFWQPELVSQRADTNLPPPALYGTPAADLEEMGQLVAQDPRFLSCTVRRFWGWMAHVEPRQVDPALVAELEPVLRESEWDARELMIAIAMHPRFSATSPDSPPYAIRPGQLDRTIRSLTGLRWQAEPEADPDYGSYGTVGLATSDDFGFRTLLGGIDSWIVLDPEPGNLPTRELALQWVAAEAADHAVEQGDLLRHGPTTDQALAREQIADLHLRFYAQVVPADDPQVDRSWQLLSSVLERSDAAHAWKVLVTAMLQDPRLVVL